MTTSTFVKFRKRVAATLSALIIAETLLPAIAFAASPTFVATQSVANAAMIQQVETLDVPRTLVLGDSVSLTVSGSVVTQNFQVSHQATMNALASLASALPNVTATFDSVNNRIVFGISTTNATPVSITVDKAPVSGTNVVANVVAVAQIARVDVPQQLIAGDVVSLSVAGSGVTVSFSGSDAATLASLTAAIDALPAVTASLSGRSVTVTAAVAGSAFGISNLTVVSSDVAAAPVVANVVPVSQVERLTLTRPIFPGDVVALTLSGVNLSQSFTGDTTTTMGLFASAIDQLSFVDAQYAAGDLTVTSAVPGTPFSVSNLSISGSALPSLTVQSNNVAVAQRDAVIFPRQTVAGDTVFLDVNASHLVQAFTGSHNETMSGLVAQVSALPNLSASFDPILDVLTVASTVPGTPFTIHSARVDSNLASANVQPNVGAVAQVESLTFGRDFVSGDQVSAVVNGNTVSASFTGTHADMVESLRAQIAAMPNISALASAATRVFTVSSSLPWTGFSLSSASLRNVVAPVVLQNNVQAVKQTSRFNIAPSIVAGDSLSVAIGSGVITQPFDTDEATTVAAFVAQLDALTLVNASYDSGTRTVTLVSQNAGDSFAVGNVSVASAAFTGSTLIASAPETRATNTVTALSVPAIPMTLAVGDCTVTLSGGIAIDASSSDCSDNAAEIDTAALSSTATLAQLLRGISGYSYSGGVALATSGTGSEIVFTRASAQVGTASIDVVATNSDLSPSTDFSSVANAPAEAVAQTDSIVLPRTLVAGDALSLTLDGATYVQNVTAAPAADFDNFVTNLDGLSGFAVTGDYATRTITVASTQPGVPFAVLQGGLLYSASSSTVTSAVAAVAQKDAFTPPHLPVVGETVSAVIDGSGYSQAFVTDGTTTLQDLASAITAGGTVTATLTGSTTVELSATVAGTPFTVGGIEVTGTTAPVLVTANGLAVAQKNTLTVPFVPASGDVFTVTVDSGSVTQAFATDSDTTLSLLNTAIEGLGTVASSLDPATRTFTLESKTAGTPFSASLSASGATLSSSGVIANEPNVMQIDSLAISRTFGPGDSLIVTVDGSGTTVPFATDTATTVANLAAWIDSLPTVSASVAGTPGNFIVTIAAEVPGVPFVGASLTVDSTIASVNVQPNVVAVAQVDSVTVPRDLVAGDVLSISLSGSTIASATFSGSEAATIATLAADIDAFSGVTATATGKVITVTAEVAGVPFQLLPLSLTGNVPSTVTQNNVVPVSQVDSVTLPALVVGDVLATTLDGHSVTASYAGSDAATVAAFASALAASGTVLATASGSDVNITAAVAGTPFALGTVAISNTASATVNTVFVPAVAQVVDFDAASVTEGWTFTATLNGKDYSYLTGTGDTDASVESAIAAMISSDTGSVIVSTGATAFTLTAAVPGVGFTFAASALDLTAPIVTTPTAVAETLKSGDTSTSTVSSNEDGTIYAVASGAVVTLPSDITAAMAAHDAFVVTSAVKDAVYTVTVPVAVNDGAYDFVAVDPSGNVSGRMLGWLTVDNTAPVLVIGTPSGQSVHAVSMTVTGSTEANAVVTVTGSASVTANADASGNFSAVLPLTHDSLNSFTFSVTDIAGNVTTRNFSVTEDGVGPAVALSASGTVYESGATFAFIGQTEPNLAVAISELSSGTVANLVSDASGSFDVPTLPLRADSVNDFTVTVTDAAGNTGTAVFTVVQDSQNPVVVLDPLPAIVDANQIAVSGTTDSNIAVSVTDGTVTLTGASDGSGVFSVTMPLVQNATNTFTVTATDLASRTGTASVSTVEDSVANGLVISTLPTTVNAVALALTGTTKPNASLSVTGGAASLTGSADIAGVWGFLVPLTANSANVLDVTSTDALGNVATGSVTIVEDSIAPVVTLSTVDHTTYALTVPVAGNTEPFAVVTVTGGSGSVTTVADASGSFVASVDLVPATANVLSLTATDAAGNVGLATVTITHDPVVVFLSLNQSGSFVTNAATFALTGTAKPNADFQVTGGAATVTGSVDASGSFATVVTLNANSINVLDVTVTDATTATATGSVTVVHDGIAPTIAFGATPTLTNALLVTVTGSTDANAVLTATDLSGSTLTGSADASGSFVMTLPLIADSNNAFVFTSTDAAGNVGTGSVFGILQDSLAPVQSALSFTSATLSTTATATYSLTTNEAAQVTVLVGTGANVDATLVSTGTTIGLSHSGTVVGLAQGTTYFAYSTATDGAGNLSQTSVMSFVTATSSGTGGGSGTGSTGGGSSSGGSSSGGGSSGVSTGGGGGGGGSGFGSSIQDSCPNGDYSSSYYDGICGTKPASSTATGSTSGNASGSTSTTGSGKTSTGTTSKPSTTKPSTSKPTTPSQTNPSTETPSGDNGDMNAPTSSQDVPGVTYQPGSTRKNDASTNMTDVAFISGFIAQKYVHVDHTAVVRTAPNFSAKAVTYLPRNYPVTVLAYGKNWSKVSYDNGIVGYIRSVFLRDGTSRDANRNDPYLFISALTQDRLVDRRKIKVAHSIFLREKPDTDSKIKAWLYDGDAGFILDEVGEWTELRTPAATGFIKTKFLGN